MSDKYISKYNTKTFHPIYGTVKDFMNDWFDFYALKEAGVWEEGTRKTDYEQQADQICRIFGYTSIFQYAEEDIDEKTDWQPVKAKIIFSIN